MPNGDTRIVQMAEHFNVNARRLHLLQNSIIEYFEQTIKLRLARFFGCEEGNFNASFGEIPMEQPYPIPLNITIKFLYTHRHPGGSDPVEKEYTVTIFFPKSINFIYKGFTYPPYLFFLFLIRLWINIKKDERVYEIY